MVVSGPQVDAVLFGRDGLLETMTAGTVMVGRSRRRLKDLTAAVESGRSVHQAMPITSLARELYQLIDAKLGGLHGSNEVLRYYLED